MYVIVISGPENEERLKGADEIANDEDVILAIGGFSKESLDSILSKKYVHPNEKTIDTIDDALVAKKYVHQDDEVLLVTSNYHMKRAKRTFERILGKSILTYPVNVPYTTKQQFSELVKEIWSYIILMYSPNREKYHEVRKILSPIINKIKKYFSNSY